MFEAGSGAGFLGSGLHVCGMGTLPVEQEDGVHNDEDRARVVHQGACDRIEHSRHGKNDGYEVESHGEGQVGFDGAHGAPGEREEVGQHAYVVVDKDNVRCVYGYIAAYAAHGYAHPGSLEGWGVVDAVAYHADRQAVPASRARL